MSRRLALMAAVVLACSGHAPDRAPPGHGSVPLAPARGDDDGAPSGGSAVGEAVLTPRPAAPGPLDQDLPRLAVRAVAMLHAISAGLDAAGDDCGVAVTKLGEVQVAFADVVAANSQVARADRRAELAAAMAPQQPALDAAAAAVFRSRAIGACMNQPAFSAAFDRALGAPAAP